MKKVLCLLLAVVMVLGLSACGKDEADSPVEPNPPPQITADDSETSLPDSIPDTNIDPDTSIVEIDPDFDVAFTIETDDGTPGSHLMAAIPEVSAATYDFSNPEIDEEYGYNNYYCPIPLTESSLTKLFQSLGEFEDHGSFMEVWKPYAESLFPEISHGGLMSNVMLYGESESGDHLFANDEKQRHSISLVAQHDGYQNITYNYTMFVATDSERYNLYDYSEVVSFIQHYTGITLTTGDVRAMQDIIAQHLDAGESTWTVQVSSNERDNYDNFRITGSIFTDNSQSWSFVAEHMISKWADLYDRDALVSSAFAS